MSWWCSAWWCFLIWERTDVECSFLTDGTMNETAMTRKSPNCCTAWWVMAMTIYIVIKCFRSSLISLHARLIQNCNIFTSPLLLPKGFHMIILYRNLFLGYILWRDEHCRGPNTQSQIPSLQILYTPVQAPTILSQVSNTPSQISFFKSDLFFRHILRGEERCKGGVEDCQDWSKRSEKQTNQS